MPTNELNEHRLNQLDRDITSLDGDIKELSEDIKGNGKKGLRERVARLEYAFLVLLVFFATHSPMASKFIEIFAK